MLSKRAEPPVLVVPIARTLGIEVYTVANWENRLSRLTKKGEKDGGESGYSAFGSTKVIRFVLQIG